MVTKIKLVILFLASLPCLFACGLGTETGNPGGPSLNPTETGNPSASPGEPCLALRTSDQVQAQQAIDENELGETELHTLMDYICLRLFICDDTIHTLACFETLDSEAGDSLVNAFGLDPESWTVGMVHLALYSETLHIDAEALETCQDDILLIDCSEITTSISAEDLSLVDTIIPVSCGEVFSDEAEDGIDGNADPCA